MGLYEVKLCLVSIVSCRLHSETVLNSWFSQAGHHFFSLSLVPFPGEQILSAGRLNPVGVHKGTPMLAHTAYGKLL